MFLKVEKLNVTLNEEKIIENLSFQVSQGEILTIMGPNGAGKSVLLRTLLGFLPYEGKIIWEQKPKIGYLPQGLTQLRVKDFPLTIQDFFALKSPLPTRSEIVRFLNLVGLEKDILTKNAGCLSGGQFQRMLVAWVLISHPQTIFFDEPTTGIDIGGGENLYSLLHTIREKEKITIFLVTHDLSIVSRYSDEVLCLANKGHNCFGTPQEILDPKKLEKVFGAKIKFYKHFNQ